jgi:hypothetical protein
MVSSKRVVRILRDLCLADVRLLVDKQTLQQQSLTNDDVLLVADVESHRWTVSHARRSHR